MLKIKDLYAGREMWLVYCYYNEGVKPVMRKITEQQDKARSLSKDLFGKENISGLVGFLIERWEKEQKTSTNFKSKSSSSNGA